jgi:hypothetical protein
MQAFAFAMRDVDATGTKEESDAENDRDCIDDTNETGTERTGSRTVVLHEKGSVVGPSAFKGGQIEVDQKWEGELRMRQVSLFDGNH